MKLLGKINPQVEEVRADAVLVGERPAAGAFQTFSMANARANEQVIEVDSDGGLIYIVGESAPEFAWTLAPHETVMIVKEG